MRLNLLSAIDSRRLSRSASSGPDTDIRWLFTGPDSSFDSEVTGEPLREFCLTPAPLHSLETQCKNLDGKAGVIAWSFAAIPALHLAYTKNLRLSCFVLLEPENCLAVPEAASAWFNDALNCRDSEVFLRLRQRLLTYNSDPLILARFLDAIESKPQNLRSLLQAHSLALNDPQFIQWLYSGQVPLILALGDCFRGPDFGQNRLAEFGLDLTSGLRSICLPNCSYFPMAESLGLGLAFLLSSLLFWTE